MNSIGTYKIMNYLDILLPNGVSAYCLPAHIETWLKALLYKSFYPRINAAIACTS